MIKVFEICLVFLFVFPLSSSYQVASNTTDVGIARSCVLLTGFEPFDEFTINPSQLIVDQLHNQTIGGCRVIGVVLPVNFTRVDGLLAHAIEQYQPVLVISLGLSPKATALEVESWAVNLKRYQLSSGAWSFPQRIDCAGPFLRMVSVDPGAGVRTLRKNNIDAVISFFAGTYLCNYVLYQNLRYMQQHHFSTKVGFVHVPLLDSQSQHGMKLDTMINGITVLIRLYVS